MVLLAFNNYSFHSWDLLLSSANKIIYILAKMTRCSNFTRCPFSSEYEEKKDLCYIKAFLKENNKRS